MEVINIILEGLDRSTMCYEVSCPYVSKNVCTASISSMLIDEKISKDCCSTENYDDCPIFLSKMLRRDKKGV
jgi:hypothetical protein